MENIIEINNLSFSYQAEKKVLDDVSFCVEKGQYVAILGHNGSGKSTIAKLIIGLLEKDAGEIMVNNKILTIDNLYEIRDQIGIVFQNPDNQFIGATVKDDIAFGLENKCVNPNNMDEIIHEFASKVGMIDFLEHEPTKLSGGQKQRVAIAGVMAMKPNIIILDEATSMLDPIGKREINELIRYLNKEEKITVISITHDIEEAKNADQIILLHDGKLIKTGSSEEILYDQKLLEELYLDIPFALKISKALKDKGIEINDHLKVENLLEEICQLHSNK